MERIIVFCHCLLCISSVWPSKVHSKALFMLFKANSECFICQNWFQNCKYLLLAIHMVTYHYFLRLVTKTSYLISLICCFFQFSGLSLPIILTFHIVSSGFVYSNANVCRCSSLLKESVQVQFFHELYCSDYSSHPYWFFCCPWSWRIPMLCLCIQLSHGCGNLNSIITLWDSRIQNMSTDFMQNQV